MFNEYNAILKGNKFCFIVNMLPVIINSNVFLENAYNKKLIPVWPPPRLLLFPQWRASLSVYSNCLSSPSVPDVSLAPQPPLCQSKWSGLPFQLFSAYVQSLVRSGWDYGPEHPEPINGINNVV